MISSSYRHIFQWYLDKRWSALVNEETAYHFHHQIQNNTRVSQTAYILWATTVKKKISKENKTKESYLSTFHMMCKWPKWTSSFRHFSISATLHQTLRFWPEFTNHHMSTSQCQCQKGHFPFQTAHHNMSFNNNKSSSWNDFGRNFCDVLQCGRWWI